MSSNISGFQGVNTPLQSMTNGKYTLADYTKMNTLFGARITALEKAVAFNPNNVTISGYVNVQPNASNSGTLQTAGAAQIGGNLQVNKSLTVTENAYIGGSLQVSGALSFASLAVNTFTSNTITNSGLTISNSFSGNGAALTAVPAVSAPYSGLTGAVPTWNQSTTGNALTATTATNVDYSGLTGLVPTWNQNTTGNAATATTATTATNSGNKTGGAAGQVLYQSGASATSFTATGVVGQVLTSQGASAPTWSTPGVVNDPTKMPLAGGTFTGPVYSFQRNTFLSYDQVLNGTYTPALSIISLWDQVQFNYNDNCNLSMVNITAEDAVYADDTRKITITKRGMAAGDYVLTLNNPPPGYLFYNATQNGVSSTTLGLGVFSHTYLVHSSYLSNPGFHLISKV